MNKTDKMKILYKYLPQNKQLARYIFYDEQKKGKSASLVSLNSISQRYNESKIFELVEKKNVCEKTFTSSIRRVNQVFIDDDNIDRDKLRGLIEEKGLIQIALSLYGAENKYNAVRADVFSKILMNMKLFYNEHDYIQILDEDSFTLRSSIEKYAKRYYVDWVNNNVKLEVENRNGNYIIFRISCGGQEKNYDDIYLSYYIREGNKNRASSDTKRPRIKRKKYSDYMHRLYNKNLDFETLGMIEEIAHECKQEMDMVIKDNKDMDIYLLSSPLNTELINLYRNEGITIKRLMGTNKNFKGILS